MQYKRNLSPESIRKMSEGGRKGGKAKGKKGLAAIKERDPEAFKRFYEEREKKRAKQVRPVLSR